MAPRSPLGEFLRSRRARVRPGDVGLRDHGGRRRVPGLRREELAQAAGLSAGYYTRLEQGRGTNPSDAVLDAVARALGLDDDERRHLYALARPTAAATGSRADAEQVRVEVRTMVESLGDVPALVMGRFLDVLAWNRSAHQLLAWHADVDAPNRPGERPNIARLLFLEPSSPALYDDWTAKARSTVADMRLIAGRHPDAPELDQLVSELGGASPEFARLWTAHDVGDCGSNTRIYHHPLVGTMELTTEILELAHDDGQRVAIFTAEPGTPSEAALRLLADMSAHARLRQPQNH